MFELRILFKMMFLKYLFFNIIICQLYIYGNAIPLIGPNVIKAQGKEFNFVASVGFENHSSIVEKNHICGGVLISQKHVLTSTHCKKQTKDFKSEYIVKIGSTDLRNMRKYKIENWFTYTEWREQQDCGESLLDEDMSIIELSKSVDIRIKPAVISKFDRDNDFIGETVVTAGWGTTDGVKYPRYMLAASLKVISPDECVYNIHQADLRNNIPFLMPGLMCTNAEPHAVLGCGDSGSPLLINGTEVIAINRATCPIQGEQFVPLEQNMHLRVDYYKVFIDHVLSEGKSTCLCCKQED